MALATITGNRSDIAGLPDRGDLWFKPTTPTETTISPRRVKAVIGTDGNFTIQLQPGTHTVTIFNNDVLFSVPADAGTHTLWSLIAAAVNLPPTTSQAKLDAAVARLVESGEIGAASDADVAAIATDPTSQTKTSLDATYVRSVNGVPVDPGTGNVEVATGGSGISVTDNGDGTFTIDDTSDAALVVNGDGTFTLTV